MPTSSKLQNVTLSFELDADVATHDVDHLEEEEETLASVDVESLVKTMAERAKNLRKVSVWIPYLSESSWTIRQPGHASKGLVVERSSWHTLPSAHDL